MEDHLDPIEAATAFVDDHFPECLVALLAGSVVRGEATATSDLDIVIVTTRQEAPYRESFRAYGWPIEAFIHTRESYLDFFASDARERTPSLQVMVTEGIVLRDTGGLAHQIKAEATAQLDRGPAPLTPDERTRYRYTITDELDDFLGSRRFAESFFVAGNLAAHAAELILITNRKWIGHGKWLPRALRRFDPAAALRLEEAVVAFCQRADKAPLVRFVEEALAPVGGPLFEGFHQSGKRDA